MDTGTVVNRRRQHHIRRGESLTFIGHEEMQGVLNNRATECRTVFLTRPTLLLTGKCQFGRNSGPQGGIGEITEDFAVEFIGARLSERGNGRPGQLVVFRLVIRGNNFVFANG